MFLRKQMYGEVQMRNRIKLGGYMQISTKQESLTIPNMIISIFIDKYRLLEGIIEKEKNNHVILKRKRITYEPASRTNASTRPECRTCHP